MIYDIKNIIATFAQKGVDNKQYNPFARRKSGRKSLNRCHSSSLKMQNYVAHRA